MGLTSFIAKPILCGIDFVINQVTVDMRVFFWALQSIPRVYLSIPVPMCIVLITVALL